MMQYNFNKKLLIEMKKAVESKAEVRVGVLSAGMQPGIDGEPVDIATLAAVHEYGSHTQNIPERSFLRSTYHNRMSDFIEFIDQNKNKIGQQIAQLGETTVLNKIGAWWVNAINETIEAQGPNWKPLSPQYLERKEQQYPGAKILMATGALRRAITHEVVE